MYLGKHEVPVIASGMEWDKAALTRRALEYEASERAARSILEDSVKRLVKRTHQLERELVEACSREHDLNARLSGANELLDQTIEHTSDLEHALDAERKTVEELLHECDTVVRLNVVVEAECSKPHFTSLSPTREILHRGYESA